MDESGNEPLLIEVHGKKFLVLREDICSEDSDFLSLDNQFFLAHSAGSPVIPAKAGIHFSEGTPARDRWIPAFAGMTPKKLDHQVSRNRYRAKLAEFFRNSPLYGLELDLERDKTPPREVEF